MEEGRITAETRQACLLESRQYQDTVYLLRCTLTENVLKILSSLPADAWMEGKTFIDPECSIGQLIIPVAIIKRQLHHTYVLSSIFGIEIKEELVLICRKRLLDICGHTDQNIKHVNNNIIHGDSLTYRFLS